METSATTNFHLLLLKFLQLPAQLPPSQCYTNRCKSLQVPAIIAAPFHNYKPRALHLSHEVAERMRCVHRCTPVVSVERDFVDAH